MPVNGFFLTGNIGSPGSVVFTITTGNGIGAFNGAYVTLQGFTLTATGTASGINSNTGYGIYASSSWINIFNCVIGSCGTAQLNSAVGGTIDIGVNAITLTGTTPVAINANYNALIWCVGSTITVTGLTVSSSFAAAILCGIIAIQAATFVGSATGTRYSATTNGVINTNGGGATFLPGSVAGSTANGGQYV